MNHGTLQLKNDRFLKIDEGTYPIDGVLINRGCQKVHHGTIILGLLASTFAM